MNIDKKILAGIGLLATALGVFLWFKRAEAAEYCCPYCGECFASYEELVEHVKTVHPGERIPLPIEWD